MGSSLKVIPGRSNGSPLNRGWYLRLPFDIKLFFF